MAKAGWDWSLFRLAVIEAGIRGELTADWRAANPDVEPAHALLEHIAEEKAELVRTTQIRKEKPLPPIHPNEVPFDIPSSWEFERVGRICGLINGKAFKPSDWEAEGLPIIRIQNLNNPNATFNHCSKEVDKRFHVKKGDVLFAWSGTPGTSFGAHIWSGSKALLNQHIYRLQFYAPVDRQFFVFAMNSRLDWLIGQAYGAAGLKHVKKGEVSALEIPFPPQSEQQEIVRILSALDGGEFDGPVHPVVARIQKLEKEFRALAGEYESQEKWLSDLRSALLHEAISGELTADWRAANPDIEPAHALLERIAEEKAELIRTKQIRKEKPLPSINPDEVPFDIPDSWEWMRLGQFARLVSGGSFKSCEEVVNGVPWIKVADLRLPQNEGHVVYSRQVVDPLEVVKKRPLTPPAVLFPKVGGALFTNSRHLLLEEPVFLDPNIFGLECISGTVHFLHYFLQTLDFAEYCKEAVLPNLQGKVVRAIPIGVPPMSEQQEIVRRLEIQLEKLDTLQLELEQSKEAGQLLMKSKLSEVFDLDHQD